MYRPPPPINPFPPYSSPQTNDLYSHPIMPFQKPPPPKTKPSYPHNKAFTYPQLLNIPSTLRSPFQTTNSFPSPSPHLSLQSLPFNFHNHNPTKFQLSSAFCQQLQPAQFHCQIQKPSPSPQLLSLSDFPGLQTRYNDFIRRRDDVKKKMTQISQIQDEEIKERELRKLIYSKPKTEEALLLIDMLRKAGSNIAFQKEIREIELELGLLNSYFQKFQGLWLRYESQLDDWKQSQDLREIDYMLQSTWNDINILSIHDTSLLKLVFRFGWFLQAKLLLRHSRTDGQFPYIQYCEDLKKKAVEGQDDKRKKSRLYQRIEEELSRHKGLLEKVKSIKQDLDDGGDLEKIDVEKIAHLLGELKEFAFDVREETIYLEEILRKAYQLRDLELCFEGNSLSVQILEPRESDRLEFQRDRKEKILRSFLVESPQIEQEELPNFNFEAIREKEKMRKISDIDESFSKVILAEKSSPIEFTSQNNQLLKPQQEERLRETATVENFSQKIQGAEQSNSVIFLDAESWKAQEEKRRRENLILAENPIIPKKRLPSSKGLKNHHKDKSKKNLILSDHLNREEKIKQSLPINSLKTDLQRLQEESMKKLILAARVIVSQKKKLPYKLAENICAEYKKHRLMIPEAKEIFNTFSQEVKQIQRDRKYLANNLQALKFEDLCKWSEKTASIYSNLEGGYDEIKSELWLAKARLIRVFSESLDKPSKPILFRDIWNLVLEGENYSESLKGITKAIFQDFLIFLTHLVEKVLQEFQKTFERKEGHNQVFWILFGFIDVKKELLEEELTRITRKPESNMLEKQKIVPSENLLKKRNAREFQDPEIDLYRPLIKKLRIEDETEECLLISQKRRDSNQASEIEFISESVFYQNHMGDLEKKNNFLWNDVSYSSFSIKKRKKSCQC